MHPLKTFCLFFVYSGTIFLPFLLLKQMTMKKIFSLLLTAGLLLTLHEADAQLRKIPAEVTDAFRAKYPSAKNVEWKDKLTSFEADFQLEGSSYAARFNSKGEWQDSEKEIEQESLPQSVKDG